MSFNDKIIVDNIKLTHEMTRLANCSLIEFAKRCHISRQTIYNIMSNKHNTSLPTLINICAHLNIDYHQFIK